MKELDPLSVLRLKRITYCNYNWRY